jgi:hypothetical protein
VTSDGADGRLYIMGLLLPGERLPDEPAGIGLA